MTHVSNSIQELHDKIQASLTHSVECEARFNCSKSEQNILDECFGQLTAKERKLDNCLLETVDGSKSKMGNTFKVKKGSKVSNANSTMNKNIVSDNSTSSCKQTFAPVVTVSRSSTDSNDYATRESKSVERTKQADKDYNSTSDDIPQSVIEEEVCYTKVDDLESVRPSPAEFRNILGTEELIPLHRDSAYGSSFESGCNNAHNARSSAELTALKKETVEPTNSNNHLSANDSIVLANKWSSSSSIASDCASEMQTNIDDSENGLCGGLLGNKESNNSKNLSSSTFSLRSSLSLESEDDFASGDDSSHRSKLGRCDNQAKAQRSWKKIRQMVAWSPFMQSFKKKYPWVQLAGHAGNFQPGEEGCILKKYDAREAACLQGLTSDPNLQGLAPTFHGTVYLSDEKYTQMEDLLLPFDNPSLMDCKMGIRTYLENELIQAREKPRLRQDMYKKMVEISPNEPTDAERKQKAVTKPRYMQWREQVSSTSNLGFRIEGIKKSSRDPSKDYKLTKTAAQVSEAFKYFIEHNVVVLEKYITRLKELREKLEVSDFFHSHEAIGSSLLFVHDASSTANVWMIDFGKTSRLPSDQKVDHRSEWIEGNREDGYLFGVDNMILLFENMLNELASSTSSLAEVDIIVTAPSPTVGRKQGQVAHSMSGGGVAETSTSQSDAKSSGNP